MIRTIRLVVVCVSVLVASAGQVYAGFVTYTDKTSFMAALASSSTDNFNDLPNFSLVSSPLNRTVGSYAYTAIANGGLLTAPGSDFSDVWLTTGNSSSLAFTINAGGPTAIGGFFFATNLSTLLTSDTVSVSINGGLFVQSVSTNSATNFFGWVSTDGTQISSLSVSSSGIPRFPTANDLIFGQANVSAVPEPTSLALFGIGACVAGVGAARRQRRDKKQAATV
jgi:hypothetical protein